MKHNKQAFTLIELLVVVLIVGILAAVAVPQYERAVAKSRLSEARTTLDALEKAIEVYQLGNGSYPDSWAALDLSFVDKEGNMVGVGSTEYLETQHFTYMLNSRDWPTCNGVAVPAYAMAKGKYDGAILMYCNNVLACGNNSSGVCQKLGFTNYTATDNCTSSVGCYTE